MQILQISVQTGQLTVENYPSPAVLSSLSLILHKYIEQLQAKVLAETALAKKLVTIGKKDWARYPLQRIKIMKQEIESASNIEEEEEGES